MCGWHGWVYIFQHFVWILTCHCVFTISIIHKDEMQDHISVVLLDHHLHKRSVSPSYDISLKFYISSSPVILRLQQNAQLSHRIPLYTIGKNGSIIPEELSHDKEKTDYYYDISNGASFYIQSNNNTKSHMYGTFHFEKDEYILEYKNNKSSVRHKETQHPRNIYNFKIWKTPTKSSEQFVESSSANINRQIYKHSRRKRAPTYHVEMLFVVDFSIYKHWYDKSTATTQAQKDNEAKRSIMQFYAFVINGMDGRYRSISPSFMSIVFAGIIISETQATSTWTESLKVQDRVDAHNALNKFSDWAKKQTDLPSNDHAMLLTRYSLSSGQSANLEGYAYVGAVCAPDSLSIMEESDDYIMFTVAAHELGHSLGAQHDGDKNGCRKDAFYIMAASSNPKLGSSNPWRFSSCSVNYFQHTIQQLDARGKNCLTSFGPGYNPNALAPYAGKLPGEIYSADEQCLKVFGNGSLMCREHYEGDFRKMCGLMWCRIPTSKGACQGMVPGDGTLCASKHWCLNGVCSYSDRAAATPDKCAHGNFIGEVEWGRTCDQVVSAEKTECYRERIALRCCASCAKVSSGVTGCLYGDRIPPSSCNKTACPYYSKEKLEECCHSCAAYFNVPSDMALPTESDGTNEILIGVSVPLVIIAVVCGILVYRRRRVPATGTRKPLSERNGKEKFARPSKPPPRKPLSSISSRDQNSNSTKNAISLPTLNSHTNKNLENGVLKPSSNLRTGAGKTNGELRNFSHEKNADSRLNPTTHSKTRSSAGKYLSDSKTDQNCLHNRSPKSNSKKPQDSRKPRTSSSEDSTLLPTSTREISKPATTIKDRIAALNTNSEPTSGKTDSGSATPAGRISDTKPKTKDTSSKPVTGHLKPVGDRQKPVENKFDKKALRPPVKTGGATANKDPLRPPEYKPIIYGRQNSNTKDV